MKNNLPVLLNKYRERCTHYLRRYGLTDYHLTFSAVKLEDANAQVTYCSGSNRWAQFRIATHVPHTDARWIDELAHHEALELLLADLATLANELYNEDVVNKEIHRIIYALVNADKIERKS